MHRSFVSSLLFVAAVLSPGCGAPPSTVIAPASVVGARPVASSTERGWLVWTHADDGTLHTVVLDDAAKIHAEAPTAVLAVDGELWAFARKQVEKRLEPCDASYSTDLGPSSEETASLVKLDGSRTLPLVDGVLSNAKHGDGEVDMGTVLQSADLAGSVGTYLFLRNGIWSYSCGAHGSWYAEASIVDARGGAKVKLPEDDKDEATRAAHDKFVVMGRENEGVDSLWSDGDPGELTEIAIEPRFENGRLSLVHIFLAEAAYAFGNSSWRSYAVETEVPAAAPAPLREALVVPPAVVTYLQREKKELGGFTEIDDLERAARALPKAAAVGRHPKPE